MTHEPPDDRLPEITGDFNRPPETPRDAMWAEIEAGLRARGLVGPGQDGGHQGAGGGRAGDVRVTSLDETRRRRDADRAGRDDDGRGRGPASGVWYGWGAAAAAVLVLGIGIGRMTAPGVAGSSRESAVEATEATVMAAAEEVRSDQAVAMRVTALDHIGRAEPLLAAVRVDARAGRLDPQVGQWGRDLLAETRLILDTDADIDPGLRELLEDLELILAQVAVLSPEGAVDEGRGRAELRLIADGLDSQDVMARIQAALPAGASLTSM